MTSPTQQLFDAFCGRDPSVFAAFCAEDLHYEDPLTPEPLESPAALGGHAERLWRSFPDARVEATGEPLSDGSHVAAPCKIVATHRGDTDGFPASGRFIVVQCVVYARLDPSGAQLWRVRSFFDLYDAAVQLGFLPKAGTIGDRALRVLRGFGVTS